MRLSTRILCSLSAAGCAAALTALPAGANPSNQMATQRVAQIDPATPAGRAAHQAWLAIEANPNAAAGHVALAWAWSRKARESGDPRGYTLSDQTVERALELAPDHFEARKIQVWNMLGRHEFVAAREAALALQKRSSDDPLLYGFIIDACVELGDFEGAEDAADWMLRMRQGAPATLTRVAHLREIFGDDEGAADLYWRAFHATRPGEVEDRAWILVQIATLERGRGKDESAAKAVHEALRLFPEYHYALAESAELAQRAGDLVGAADLFERRYAAAAHPENRFQLGLAQRAAGQHDAAAASFAAFETAALAESTKLDNANVELIEYWIGVCEPPRIEDGLALAEKRAATQRDLRSLAILARARLAAGDLDGAREAAEGLVAPGTRDAGYRLLAAQTVLAAAHENCNGAARESLAIAIDQDPHSAAGRAAHKLLAELPTD